MTPLVDNLWDIVEKEYKKYEEKDSNFIFAKDKQDEFKKQVDLLYKDIKRQYMLPTVKHLDRHKMAACIIIKMLEMDIISYKKVSSEYLFIGAELIALKVGLSYMRAKVNEKLAERKVIRRMKRFTFPEAQACETPYIEIICRNLYYAKRDFVFNPLDLADRLFLLEYISLQKQRINPNRLKDY